MHNYSFGLFHELKVILSLDLKQWNFDMLLIMINHFKNLIGQECIDPFDNLIN